MNHSVNGSFGKPESYDGSDEGDFHWPDLMIQIAFFPDQASDIHF